MCIRDRDAREGGQQDLPVVVNGNRVAVVPPYACLTERDTGNTHFTQNDSPTSKRPQHRCPSGGRAQKALVSANAREVRLVPGLFVRTRLLRRQYRNEVPQRSTATPPPQPAIQPGWVASSRAQRPIWLRLREVRDEEAAGSNPVTPTVFRRSSEVLTRVGGGLSCCQY